MEILKTNRMVQAFPFIAPYKNPLTNIIKNSAPTLNQVDTLQLSSQTTKQPFNVNQFDREISAITKTRITTNNKAEIFIDGNNAYKAMHELLDSAKESINMSMYIFSDDKTAWNIAQKLVKKAKEGVKVNLLVDAVGIHGYSNIIFNYLKCAGVNLIVNNPPSVADIATIDKRDHNKIVVVDGQTAMTGGMNIADEYENKWHDMMVKLKGEVVHDIQQTFIRNWEKSRGTIQDKKKLFPVVKEYNGNLPSRVVATNEDEQNIKNAVFNAIDSAKKYINMEVAYFADSKMVDKLIDASKRGVKVKIILPKVSDVTIADTAAQYYFNKMLKAGIEIYLYKDRILHTKAMSVDGIWGTVGSANMDCRAFDTNREMNVCFSDAKTVTELDQKLFEKDFNTSEKLKSYKPSLLNRIVHVFEKMI